LFSLRALPSRLVVLSLSADRRHFWRAETYGAACCLYFVAGLACELHQVRRRGERRVRRQTIRYVGFFPLCLSVLNRQVGEKRGLFRPTRHPLIRWCVCVCDIVCCLDWIETGRTQRTRLCFSCTPRSSS
jgi:hypothetical protein